MERIRRLVRKVLGYNNPIYRFSARLADDLAVISSEGVGTWRALRRLGSSNNCLKVQTIKLQRLQYPIAIRAGTKDVLSIISNCVREEYGQFQRDFDPQFIIDAGAYIGDTSAYFLTRFPRCCVVALEPNDDSRVQAEKNLACYQPRVELIGAALFDSVGSVTFGGTETGASIGGGDIEVPTTTVPALLARYDKERIDILKMDIEGAETTVLRSGDNDWLKSVRLLLLGTYGPRIEAEVLPLLARNGFEFQRFRNLWYCRNLNT